MCHQAGAHSPSRLSGPAPPQHRQRGNSKIIKPCTLLFDRRANVCSKHSYATAKKNTHTHAPEQTEPTKKPTRCSLRHAMPRHATAQRMRSKRCGRDAHRTERKKRARKTGTPVGVWKRICIIKLIDAGGIYMHRLVNISAVTPPPPPQMYTSVLLLLCPHNARRKYQL